MNLKDIVRTGDILITFPEKGSFIGNAISKITFGKVNHASIVYDNQQGFETDTHLMKAGFFDLKKYVERQLLIIRGSYVKPFSLNVKYLCNLYKGNPYSYWDIATNALFFFLTRQIRSKVVGLFGNKQFMVCSELVARILYEATQNKIWKDFEGLTPEDIRDIALENPETHRIIHYNPLKVGG